VDHFLGHHGVYICLQSETHFIPGQAFRFTNYVCHCTDQITKGGGIAVLFSRSIDHRAVPVLGLRHLEATAIQITLAGTPVKVLAVYLSPSKPLIKRDLSACLDWGGGVPVLMVWDLNAKHMDWNSRLTAMKRRLA
jgi:hypothetical protein